MSSKIAFVLSHHESELLSEWSNDQLIKRTSRSTTKSDAELRGHCETFLHLLRTAVQHEHLDDTSSPEWQPVLSELTEISRERGLQGFSPSETAGFIFSLKRPLFQKLRQVHGDDSEALFKDLWVATHLLDNLGLYTTEVHQTAREQVITRQQEEMLELSTPVIKLWEGVIALPLIGTLDSSRTSVVMENLLQRLVETSAPIAILDITGVPVVDTLTAQHLLKTISAARLMGADCIISGIRPQIAQTIVELGVDLGEVVTKSTLADAFALALRRNNLAIRPRERRAKRPEAAEPRK